MTSRNIHYFISCNLHLVVFLLLLVVMVVVPDMHSLALALFIVPLYLGLKFVLVSLFVSFDCGLITLMGEVRVSLLTK